MDVFEWVVFLLAGAVLLASVARRIGAPYPALLAVGGALLALVPGGPRLTLDPTLALALFVAPVLLDAAYDASLRDLRENWAPLAGLIVVCVGLTTAAVAWVAHALRPELPLAAAMVLGAVVAPPDAAAATAVLRQLRPPHRILVILEGESLLNDAVALLVYRLGMTLVLGDGARPIVLVPSLLLAIVGSVVAGWALASIYQRLMRRVADVPSNIVLQFVGTFGVWILAERVHLSGVLTIVTYAVTLAHRPESFPARLRVPSYAVWDAAVFVLNVLAFVLIGLQIRPIVDRLTAQQRAQDLWFAAAVLMTVIVVRVTWVMTYNTAVRWKIRRYGVRQPRPMLRPTVRGGLIISWCGMRGIVTLAAALALPERFPGRDLIVLTAFAVVVGTLVVQGLSLRPLLRLIDLHDDNPVEREIRLAWTRGLEAALAALDGAAPRVPRHARAPRRQPRGGERGAASAVERAAAAGGGGGARAHLGAAQPGRDRRRRLPRSRGAAGPARAHRRARLIAVTGASGASWYGRVAVGVQGVPMMSPTAVVAGGGAAGQLDAFASVLPASDDERLRVARALERFPDSIRVRGLFFEGLERIVALARGPEAWRGLAARAGIEPQRAVLDFFPHRDFYKVYLLAALELHPHAPLADGLYRVAQSFYPMFKQSLIGRAMSTLIGDNGGRLIRVLPDAYAHSVHGNEHAVERVSEREYRWSCAVEPFDDYPSIFAGIVEGALRAQQATCAQVETLHAVLGASRHKFLFKITW
jgi:Na+/H+ antiporter